jgi:hypothetical protein
MNNYLMDNVGSFKLMVGAIPYSADKLAER